MWLDPSPYKSNWTVDAICEHLQAVVDGQITRLLANVPPRFTKSICVSSMLPAWVWAQPTDSARPMAGPGAQFLHVPYAERLSIRDNVAFRRIIESPRYQRWFGDQFQLTDDQNTKIRVENDKGGYSIASSITGSVTGEGAGYLDVNDPHNVVEGESETVRESTVTTFRESLSTRVNDLDLSAIIVTMQRINQKDLSGYILEMGGYVHLMIPMEHDPKRSCVTQIGWKDPRTEEGELAWPERFSAEGVERLQRALGPYASAGQLQQSPIARDGALYRREWFKILDEAPPLEEFAVILRRWDLAGTEATGKKKPCYTAGVKIGVTADHRVVIHHVDRFRLGPGDVEKRVRAVAEQDGTGIPIGIEQEPGSAGKTVIQNYVTRVLAGFSVYGKPSTGNKFQDMEPLAAQAQVGNLYLVRGPWNEAFIGEAEVAPNGEYVDQIDAASRGYNDIALPEMTSAIVHMDANEHFGDPTMDSWEEAYS